MPSPTWSLESRTKLRCLGAPAPVKASQSSFRHEPSSHSFRSIHYLEDHSSCSSCASEPSLVHPLSVITMDNPRGSPGCHLRRTQQPHEFVQLLVCPWHDTIRQPRQLLEWKLSWKPKESLSISGFSINTILISEAEQDFEPPHKLLPYQFFNQKITTSEADNYVQILHNNL